MNNTDKCFACNKTLKSRPYPVDTRDDQVVMVGPECFKHIKKAGADGYQPPLGGPKLYWPVLEENAVRHTECIRRFQEAGGIW